MPCLCYNCKFKHSLKLLSVLCKHFKTSAYRITLWQLMICKIQLTVCKHKKAVGNEKRAKTSKIDKAFMTAWHFPSTGTTATFLKYQCLVHLNLIHYTLVTQPFLINRNGVVYIWTSKWKADCDSYITDWQHKQNLHKWPNVLEKHRGKVCDRPKVLLFTF